MGPGRPYPPPSLEHWGQEMSLPYAMGPGTGARGALAGRATVTGAGTEDAPAERINVSVAAIVVSRPGRRVGARSTTCVSTATSFQLGKDDVMPAPPTR